MADVRNHPNWLQHAADVMVLLATDGAVLDVTESAESLFGYPLAEIIG